MKQVWVKSATCARTASTTRGAELPMVVTAIPEPKSMNRLPSTSSTMPPAARAANTGMVFPTPCDTAAARRLVSSSDAGPGISVTRWRLCSTADTSAAYRCRAPATRGNYPPGGAGGPSPSGRHTLVVGSQYWPGSQFSGVGPTPSGKQALLNGSQYWPASHCAELTAGVAIVMAAIGVNAITATGARRRTNFLIYEPPKTGPSIESTVAKERTARAQSRCFSDGVSGERICTPT